MTDQGPKDPTDKPKKQPTEEELRALREQMGKSLIERDERRERWKWFGKVGEKLSERVSLWRRMRWW